MEGRHWMDNTLKFINIVTHPHQKYRRKEDLLSFEYTYKSEVTSVYPLTKTENLYHIQIIDPEERRRFSFSPGQFLMLEVPGIG